MHGYWVVHEACLQLRGQAGERQIARHEVAAVSSGGGPLCGVAPAHILKADTERAASRPVQSTRGT